VIYAYGLEDPVIIDGKATITYHGDRRYTRVIPLQSYANPPPESKFAGLDYFNVQVNNVSSLICTIDDCSDAFLVYSTIGRNDILLQNIQSTNELSSTTTRHCCKKDRSFYLTLFSYHLII
jgi:hypothetical protein